MVVPEDDPPVRLAGAAQHADDVGDGARLERGFDPEVQP